MNTLCDLFGKSRQAYYQQTKYNYKEEVKKEILLQLVEKERRLMPRIGGRKLLQCIQPSLPEELYLGRDLFFDFLRENNLLVRKRRSRIRTTYSNHWLRKYPNLIKEFTANRPNQLWVSDITYINTLEGFGYLSLVTDAYSRKIIGWQVGSTLEARYTVKALQMALKQLPKGVNDVYHHSDRGVQYCCDQYVKLLNKNHFQISMTENGDPRENAIAERVNGILKDEWLNQIKFKTRSEATSQLEQIIRIYNQNRPHSSLDMRTPEYAHHQSGILKKHWKNYYQKINIEQEQKINSFI
jgi:transposase InsO family protein